MWDRTTEKYCFVNLTYSHVCTCRFDTQWDALEDMRNNDEVAEFYRLDLENTRHQCKFDNNLKESVEIKIRRMAYFNIN